MNFVPGHALIQTFPRTDWAVSTRNTLLLSQKRYPCFLPPLKIVDVISLVFSNFLFKMFVCACVSVTHVQVPALGSPEARATGGCKPPHIWVLRHNSGAWEELKVPLNPKPPL